MTYLTHLSESKLEQLRTGMGSNLDRYRGGGFGEFAREPGWAIDLDQKLELDGLAALDGSDNSAETDLKDSLVVLDVLGDLSPSLANEERIWVRLSHIEGFEFAQRRWLRGAKGDEELLKSIEAHMFARTHTRLRDDHALSRLWWNGYVAKHCYPENLRRGLELLIRRADVRSNLVERVWVTGRRKLAGGIFRAMDGDPFVLQSQLSFREFMKAVNLFGAGIVFEAMSDAEIDGFLRKCSDEAQDKLNLNGNADAALETEEG